MNSVKEKEKDQNQSNKSKREHYISQTIGEKTSTESATLKISAFNFLDRLGTIMSNIFAADFQRAVVQLVP